MDWLKPVSVNSGWIYKQMVTLYDPILVYGDIMIAKNTYGQRRVLNIYNKL